MYISCAFDQDLAINNQILLMQELQKNKKEQSNLPLSKVVIIDLIDQMMESMAKIKHENKQKSVLTIQQLPIQLIQFLKGRDIRAQQLLIQLPRYVRLKPNYIKAQNYDYKKIKQNIIATLQFDKKQSNSQIKPQIVQIDSQFFALPSSININNTHLYNQGILYGMDFASSIPVRALNLKQNCRVLELCTAPGNKAMYMADLVQNIKIIGVDASYNRCKVMESLIKKYQKDWQQKDPNQNEDSYKKSMKIQVITADGITYKDQEKFDRVLIDAECTHEGSAKHIKKFLKDLNKQGNQKQKPKKRKKNEKSRAKQQQKQYKLNNSNPYTQNIEKPNNWDEQAFRERFLDPLKLKNLHDLQYGLLQNGFSLLKEDGVLVYSTCSFDRGQNENIVQQFLENHKKQAMLWPIQCYTENIDKLNLTPFKQGGVNSNLGFVQGFLQGTIRMKPSVTRTGGMFVARIKKN